MLGSSLSNTNANNPYRQQRQLRQTAWSPRPSNEGALCTHQIRSTHEVVSSKPCLGETWMVMLYSLREL